MVVKQTAKNLYEVLIVFKSNLSEEELGKNISQIESTIKNFGGSIVKVDEPMRRKFTHKMSGEKDGYYVSILFNSPPEAPNNLKRALSIADDILRYIVVRKES